MTITNADPDDTQLVNGDFLIDYRFDGSFHIFSNIRPVIDSNARDFLQITPNNFGGTFTYELRDFVDADVLVLTNDDRANPQVDTVRVNSATNTWDFTETPTVGGVPIGGELPQIFSVSLQTYHCRLRQYPKIQLLCTICLLYTSPSPRDS